MRVARILIEQMVGETRLVALDGAGKPVALRLERDSDAQRLQYGQQYIARIRAIAPEQGGAFLSTNTGEEAFLRTGADHNLVEGAAINVHISAEARAGKLARAAKAQSSAPSASPRDAWVNALPDGAAASQDAAPIGDPEVSAAFEDALTPTVTLPTGGLLRIEHTSALTAADIDTAGRKDQGRPASRALKINIEAATELARQVHLRGLGGLLVLDCVAPLNRDAGDKIKTAFSDRFKALTERKARTLRPSDLGLMEVALAWGETPLRDRMMNADATLTPESLALEGLRALQREAVAAPMQRFTLALPEAANTWLKDSRVDLRAALHDRYGHRFTYQVHTALQPEVFPSP